MKKNINDYERVARVLGGIALSSLAFVGPRKKWFLSFLIPAAEGIVGKCLMYSAFNFSTRNEVSEEAKDYMQVQSDSELAAGHPIVGVS